jgi:hypothetical protein
MTASTDDEGEREAMEAELLAEMAGRSTTARVTEGALRRLAIVFFCGRRKRKKGKEKRVRGGGGPRERGLAEANDGQEGDAFSFRFFFARRLDSSPPLLSSLFERASRSALAPIVRTLSRSRPRTQRLAES